MTHEDFFNQLKTPINWKYIGPNHNYDDVTEEMTGYGKIFDDWHNKKIIRVCFTLDSKRCLIVERTGSKYKSVCNIRAAEIDRINELIHKLYN